MEAITIKADVREKIGKSCRTYRTQGLIPAVMYGQGNNIPLLLNSADFMKLYPKLTKSTLVNLTVDSKNYEVLIKDYTFNHIKDKFTHIDFYELKAGKPVHSKLQLEFVGNAIGLKEGGMIEKHLMELDIECLPKFMLPSFDVDITDMVIGDTLYVKDINLGENYRILSNDDEVVLHMTGNMMQEEEIEEVETGEGEEEEGVIGETSETEEEEDKKE